MNLRKLNLRKMPLSNDPGVHVQDTKMLKCDADDDAAFKAENKIVEYVTKPQPKTNLGGGNSHS